jgi:hypothetical protein
MIIEKQKKHDLEERKILPNRAFLCTQAHKEDSCLEQHAPGTSSRRLKSLASYSMIDIYG